MWVSAASPKKGARHEDYSNAVVKPPHGCVPSTRSDGATNQWHARIAERDDHRGRQANSIAAAEIRRRDQGNARGLEGVVAAAEGAAQRRAERAADHDRRPGLRGQRNL